MAREAEAFFKRLAFLLAEKRKSVTLLLWDAYAVNSFAPLRSAIPCVRGSRRMKREDYKTDSLVEATAACRLFYETFLSCSSTFIL